MEAATVTEVVAVMIVTLAVGVWCGIRFARHRRDWELDDLLG